MSLAVCMIVKNEEAVLEDSLRSIAAIADEIIITDTGSTDGTVDIAKKYTSKIYHFPWVDDFSKALNFSHQHSNSEYNMRWDADFVLRPESLSELKKVKEANFQTADIVSFTWNIEFGLENKPVKSLRRWFIYKSGLFHFASPIHAEIVPNDSSGDFSHKYFPTVAVDHLKDKEEKSHRYQQTLRLVRNQLQSNPDNFSMLFSYAEALIFEKKFAEAVSILQEYLRKEQRDNEKKVLALEHLVLCYFSLQEHKKIIPLLDKYSNQFQNHPRYILAKADALALVDEVSAISFFKKYLQNPLSLTNSNYVFDHERHRVHPHIMLGTLLKKRDPKKSRQHLQTANNVSRLKATKNRTKILIDNLNSLQ